MRKIRQKKKIKRRKIGASKEEKKEIVVDKNEI